MSIGVRTVPHTLHAFSPFILPKRQGGQYQHHFPILDEDGHRRELQGLAQGAERVLTPEPTSCSWFLAVTQVAYVTQGHTMISMDPKHLCRHGPLPP